MPELLEIAEHSLMRLTRRGRNGFGRGSVHAIGGADIISSRVAPPSRRLPGWRLATAVRAGRPHRTGRMSALRGRGPQHDQGHIVMLLGSCDKLVGGLHDLIDGLGWAE